LNSLTISSRIERARELKRQGKKIIGYFCCYTPVELITAAGLVPFRLTGTAGRPTAQAEGFVETVMCPFIRNVFQMRMDGEYDFIDGLVMGNTCDNIYFSYAAFNDYWKTEFSHFLDIPHKVTVSAQAYYRSEFDRFRYALNEFAGVHTTDEALVQSIDRHNRNRALQRDLNDLRRDEPPQVSASDTLDTVIANLGMPVEEGNQLLEETIASIKSGQARHPKHGQRLLLWGSQLDSTKILDIIEDCGANVVADDLCIGYRSFRHNIEVTPDPMDGLTAFYSNGQLCARTYREGTNERFGHIKELARDFKIDGVILYLLRYCDINGFDILSLRDYLDSIGLTALVIEDDYTGGALAQIKTRVQAFIEIIEAR